MSKIIESIEYIVSEWGFLREFESLNEAIIYCFENNITNSDDGLLWIHSTSYRDLEKLLSIVIPDPNFMRFKWIDEKRNWIWDFKNKYWVDCTEIENEGEKDFDIYYSGRKNYLEKKKKIINDLRKIN